MSSLDRLIALAKRTGDRLIIHDPSSGQDMVILDIDSYERLMVGRKDVRSLSERELLDQINRDIAIWRAGLTTEQDDYDDYQASESENSSWARASNILEQTFKRLRQTSTESGGSAPLVQASQIDPVSIAPAPTEGDVEEKIEPVRVPYVQSGEVESEQKPLSPDEPVFYEEPV